MRGGKVKIVLFVFLLLIFISIADAVQIIIDNTDNDYSDTGTWGTAFNSCGYNGDYRFETTSNDNDTAIWRLNITINATYDVFVHYCVHSLRPQEAPYKIFHSGGNSFVKINQTQNSSGVEGGDFTSSGFRYIGTFPFNTNGNQFIELNTSSVGDTSSDAIMISTGPYINNKTISSSCVFGNQSVELFANISSPQCIGNVTFSVIYQNGTNQNFSGKINTNPLTIFKGNYSVVLSNFTSSQTVNWTVYVHDCFNNLTRDGNESFYVNRRTELNVTPIFPDGLNGWYISEPIFTLANSDAISLLFKWDALSEQGYSGPFNMADAPNNGSATGGINVLHYWSNVTCGVEPQQNLTIKADFRNSLISNIIPVNFSIVYNNFRPTIGALLDDIFGSNSGINQTSINMFVDGITVPFIINDSESNISLTIRHSPSIDLSLGMHNITINVSDVAGRNSELTWFFFINMTNFFNLSVNYPINGSYEKKQVLFNITTTSIVKNISFINYNDPRPRYKVLCRNCDQYGFSMKRTQNLHEEFNNITIRAIDGFGNVKEESFFVFIDSKKPKVLGVLPRRNSFFNGSFFFIKYSEENLRNITLFFNPNTTLSGCASGINKNCSLVMNLSDFEGQNISFYFALSDIVRTILSPITKVKIDTIVPEINITKPIDNESINATQVPFNISISERVVLEYMNLNETSPKFRTLCNNCNQYGELNKKSVLFKKGNHSLLFRARDKAGNSDTKQVNINVV